MKSRSEKPAKAIPKGFVFLLQINTTRPSESCARFKLKTKSL